MALDLKHTSLTQYTPRRLTRCGLHRQGTLTEPRPSSQDLNGLPPVSIAIHVHGALATAAAGGSAQPRDAPHAGDNWHQGRAAERAAGVSQETYRARPPLPPSGSGLPCHGDSPRGEPIAVSVTPRWWAPAPVPVVRYRPGSPWLPQARLLQVAADGIDCRSSRPSSPAILPLDAQLVEGGGGGSVWAVSGARVTASPSRRSSLAHRLPGARLRKIGSGRIQRNRKESYSGFDFIFNVWIILCLDGQ